MSVTLTENRTVYSLGRTLADYDLQHSGEENDVSEAPNARPAPQGAGDNPADWVDNYRRVPDYRPVDHTLDFAYRDTTQNGIERAFIWNMFSGIVLTSVCEPVRRNEKVGVLTWICRQRTDSGGLLVERSTTHTSAGRLEESTESGYILGMVLQLLRRLDLYISVQSTHVLILLYLPSRLCLVDHI